MKKKINQFSIVFAGALALVLTLIIMIACEMIDPGASNKEPWGKNPAEIKSESWAKGTIAPAKTNTETYVVKLDEQWFKFTASITGKLNIHIRFGTINSVDVELYDATGEVIVTKVNIYRNKNEHYFEGPVTLAQDYYVKVQPNSQNEVGTFYITFSTNAEPPLPPPDIMGTPLDLTAGGWTEGRSLGTGQEQWSKFTATATTQYIFVRFSVISGVKIQLYRADGTTIVKEASLSGNPSSTTPSERIKSIPTDLTSTGQVYYVRIQQNSGTGLYHISFSDSDTIPSFN